MPQKKNHPGKVQEKSATKVEIDLGQRTIQKGGSYEGLPYRGPSLVMKDNDPDYMKPQRKLDGQAYVFNMTNADDLEKYSEIMHGMVNGRIILGQRKIVYDRDLKNFVVFLEWTEQYYGPPPTID